MTALIRRASQTPYFWIGFFALFFVSLSLLSGVREFVLNQSPSFTWQVGTGLLLLAVLSYQWVLLIVRHMKLTSAARLHFLAHRWFGIIATVLFLVHVLRVGHAWMAILTVVFFLTALTGLFNKEIVRYKYRWMYLTWLGLHITFSALMVPLIAVHVWVALVYQGGN